MRRIAAVILAVIACALAIWFLFAVRVEGTLGDPEFVIGQLDQADIYEFIYGEVALLAIQETREEVEDPAIDFARFDQEIVDAIRAAFPPEWVQEQTEMVIREFVPYLKGEEDSFSITIPLDERIRNAGPDLKAQLETGRVVETIYDDVVVDQIDESLADGVSLFGQEFTSEELIESIRVVAPPTWVTEQLSGGIDAVLPYLAGDTDTFTVVFDVSQRIDAARAELVSLVDADNLTTFVFEEIIDPIIGENIGNDFRLPFNLSLTEEDVEQIMREALPPAWIREQASEVIDQTAAFIVGDTQTFSVLVPLADREEAALESIGRLMDSRLEAAYRTAPLCTAEQVRTLDFNAFANNGITCRPPGVSLPQVKAAVDLTDYQAAVREEVGRALPDTFRFNERDLRDAFGEGQSEQLDDLRRWLTEGFTFTQEDLEEQLAKADWEDDNPGSRWDDLDPEARRQLTLDSDLLEDFHEARDRIRGGFSYDEVEFLQDLNDASDDDDAADDFLEGRKWLRRATTWNSLGWGLFSIMTIGVGMLGGRRLYSKFLWSSVVVLVAGLLVLVGSTPAWTNNSDDRIEREFEEELARHDLTELERVLLRKGETVGLDASKEFLSGFRSSSIILVAVGGGMLLAGIGLMTRRRDDRWDDFPSGHVPRSQLDLPEDMEEFQPIPPSLPPHVSEPEEPEPPKNTGASMDYGLRPDAEAEADEAEGAAPDDEPGVVDAEVTELPVEDIDEPAEDAETEDADTEDER